MQLYPWRRIDPVPWAALRTPLSRARLALVTSAGLYRPGKDEPFARALRGDFSFRVLDSDVPLRSLVVGQPSEAFDHGPLEADRNVGLPLDRVRELVAVGEVGALAPLAISFSGSILAPGRLVKETAPKVAQALRGAGVDAALFVPV